MDQNLINQMSFEDRLRYEQIQREKRVIETKNDPEVIATARKRMGGDASLDDLVMLEAKFSPVKVKDLVATAPKPDNNGWGKEFTPEQLANAVIDSDLTTHRARSLAPKPQDEKSKKNKGKGKNNQEG